MVYGYIRRALVCGLPCLLQRTFQARLVRSSWNSIPDGGNHLVLAKGVFG